MDLDQDFYVEAVANRCHDSPQAEALFPCIGRGKKRPLDLRCLVLPKAVLETLPPLSDSSFSSQSKRIGKGRAQMLREHASGIQGNAVCCKSSKKDEHVVPLEYAQPEVLDDATVLSQVVRGASRMQPLERPGLLADSTHSAYHQRKLHYDLVSDFPPLTNSLSSCSSEHQVTVNIGHKPCAQSQESPRGHCLPAPESLSESAEIVQRGRTDVETEESQTLAPSSAYCLSDSPFSSMGVLGALAQEDALIEKPTSSMDVLGAPAQVDALIEKPASSMGVLGAPAQVDALIEKPASSIGVLGAPAHVDSFIEKPAQSEQLGGSSNVSTCESLPVELVTVIIKGLPDEETTRDMLSAYGDVADYQHFEQTGEGSIIQLSLEREKAEFLRSNLNGSDLFEGRIITVSILE